MSRNRLIEDGWLAHVIGCNDHTHGTGALSNGAVKVSRRSTGIEVACPSPFIVIDRGQPATLRLNGDQYRFPEPPDLRTMTDAAVQMEFLTDPFVGVLRPFLQPAEEFPGPLFRFRRRNRRSPASGAQRTARPLRRNIRLPRLDVVGTPAAARAQLPYDGGENYAAADFAFIVDGQRIAILLGRGPYADRLDQRETAKAGKDRCPNNRDYTRAVLADILPQQFAAFWRDQHLPSSRSRVSPSAILSRPDMGRIGGGLEIDLHDVEAADPPVDGIDDPRFRRHRHR